VSRRKGARRCFPALREARPSGSSFFARGVYLLFQDGKISCSSISLLSTSLLSFSTFRKRFGERLCDCEASESPPLLKFIPPSLVLNTALRSALSVSRVEARFPTQGISIKVRKKARVGAFVSRCFVRDRVYCCTSDIQMPGSPLRSAPPLTRGSWPQTDFGALRARLGDSYLSTGAARGSSLARRK